MQAAKSEDSEAQRKVGECYLNGWGCKIDVDEYLFWLNKAANQKDISALEDLGLYYLENAYDDAEDKEQAYNYLLKAAELGSGSAQFYIARFYLHGIHVTLNIETAVSWYEKAVEKGSALACEDLANFYRHGLVTNKSSWNASYYEEKASEKGSPIILFNKGVHYLIGYNCQIDKVKAQECFAKIDKKHLEDLVKRCDLGFITVFDKFNLGIYAVMMKEEDSHEKDLIKIEALLEEARKEGHPYAKLALDILIKKL